MLLQLYDSVGGNLLTTILKERDEKNQKLIG